MPSSRGSGSAHQRRRPAGIRFAPSSTITAIRSSTIGRPASGATQYGGAAAFTLNGFFIYNIPIGLKKLGPMPPGIMIMGGPNGTFNLQTLQADALPRFRVGLVVNAQNLTNHTNYVGYSGTLTSPFFGLPTAVQGMRTIDVGLNFNF